MTIPTKMSDLSTTAASNSPSGSDAASTIDDNQRIAFAILRGLSILGTDIASASSIAPAAFGSLFKVSGTTTVTAIASTNSWIGRCVTFWHTGAQTWTASSTLNFADSASRTFANGDRSTWVDTDGAGTWYCLDIAMANPKLGPPASGATLGLNSTNSVPALQLFAATSNSPDIEFFVNAVRKALIGVAGAAGQLSGGSAQFETVVRSNGFGVSTDDGTSVAWRVDTAGRKLNPSVTQPHFFANLSASQTSGRVVLFDNEVTDTASAYDPTTGVFTVPVTGTYVLAANLQFLVSSATNDTRYFAISCTTAGIVAAGAATVLAATLNNATTSVGMFAVVHLTATEQVSVIVDTTALSATSKLVHTAGGGLNPHQWNTFSGYLLG